MYITLKKLATRATIQFLVKTNEQQRRNVDNTTKIIQRIIKISILQVTLLLMISAFLAQSSSVITTSQVGPSKSMTTQKHYTVKQHKCNILLPLQCAYGIVSRQSSPRFKNTSRATPSKIADREFPQNFDFARIEPLSTNPSSRLET